MACVTKRIDPAAPERLPSENTLMSADDNPPVEELQAMFNRVPDWSVREMIARLMKEDRIDEAIRRLTAYRDWKSKNSGCITRPLRQDRNEDYDDREDREARIILYAEKDCH